MCAKCQEEHCLRCEFNAEKCTECDVGYRMNGDNCEKCSAEGCMTCKSSTDFCEGCMSDHVLGG